MHGGALRDSDIRDVFELIDDEQKHFLWEKKEFHMLLTLMGFVMQDQPEIQNVIVQFDRRRPSRSSREHKIFELGDCVEVIDKLTSKPQNQAKDFNPATSFI